MAYTAQNDNKIKYLGNFEMSYVYIIENKITDKLYVGYTSLSPEIRWRAHLDKLHSGRSGALYAAMRKYGIENFEMVLVERCVSKEAAEQRETYWIKNLNTLAPLGYNLTEGGTGGIPASYVKEKISKSVSGNKHPNFGKSLSKKTRDKISEAHKGKQWFLGKTHSKETRQKMREMRIGPNNPMWGKTYQHTEETKRKLSRDRMGQGNPNFGKKASKATKEKMSEARRRWWAKQKADLP